MTLAGTGSCLYGASVTNSATGTFCASSSRAMSMTLLAPCEWPTSTIASVLASRPVENTPNQPRNKITRVSARAGLQERTRITAITPTHELTYLRPLCTRLLQRLSHCTTKSGKHDKILLPADRHLMACRARLHSL